MASAAAVTARTYPTYTTWPRARVSTFIESIHRLPFRGREYFVLPNGTPPLSILRYRCAILASPTVIARLPPQN